MNGDGQDLLKGFVAGAVGGLVASAVMNGFQQRFGSWITGDIRSHGAQSVQPGPPDSGIGRYLERKGLDDPRDDSAERLANAASVAATGRPLAENTKAEAGTALHYGFGISTAAAYGAAAELMPVVTAGAGMPYGAAVWLGADEGVVPLLGLSKGPAEYPLRVHALALASHLVYGLTVEAVRRGVRAAL